MTSTHHKLAVVGGGMVAHRLVEALRDRDADGSWSVDLYCEESHAPYDRVALTSYFSGKTPTDLLLGERDLGEDPLVTVHLGTRVTAIDTGAKSIRVGEVDQPYDALVLATGSSAFV